MTTVVAILAKATLALLLGLFAAGLARRARAATRHSLLAAAFGVVLTLPLAAIALPAIRIPALAVSTRRAFFSPTPSIPVDQAAAIAVPEVTGPLTAPPDSG